MHLPLEARLVVASHGEDLSWIEQARHPACAYDATCSRPGLMHVPNVAREAGQWLRHIVANHGRFADWEIFLQGDPFAHCPGLLRRLHLREYTHRPVTALGGTQGYVAGHPHPHSRAADRFASEFLGRVPDGCRWVRGAQFAAAGPVLQSRPLHSWERLLEKVLAEKSSSPWAMERLWLHILGS